MPADLGGYQAFSGRRLQLERRGAALTALMQINNLDQFKTLGGFPRINQAFDCEKFAPSASRQRRVFVRNTAPKNFISIQFEGRR